MNQKSIIIIVGGLLVLVGIFLAYKNMSSSPSEQPVPIPSKDVTKKLIIVAFGDSLTAGYGVNLEDSYPSLLQKKLEEKGIEATVINMGVTGETTQGGRERIDFVLEQKPDLILLGLGGNDMLRSLPVEQTKANLEFIIEGLQKGNRNIILLGMESTVTNGPGDKERFDAIYRDLADKYSLPLVPFFLKGVALVGKYNSGDGIHPNRDGYELIVNDNILPVVLPFIQDTFIK